MRFGSIFGPRRKRPKVPRMRGLTKILPRMFAPRYRWQKVRRSAAYCSGPRRRRCARSHGTKVDQSLRRWVDADPAKLQPDAALLVQEFEQRGWVPLASQLPVWKSSWKLWTKVDLVLQDSRTDEILSVEVKTGCRYRHLGVHVLRHVTPQVSDCLLHQHQLQSLLACDMLRETYPRASPCSAVLVYVDGTTVDVYRQEQFSVCPDAARAALD